MCQRTCRLRWTAGRGWGSTSRVVTTVRSLTVTPRGLSRPPELIERERGLRAAWVLDRLAALVSHAYADEGLQLRRVHAV
jgi:hypothetical protein